MAQNPPPGFTVDAPASSGPPPGFTLDAPPQASEAPPNSVIGGVFRRGVDIVKSVPQLLAPPQNRSEALASVIPVGGPAALRTIRSAYESGKEGLQQAKQQFQSADTSDPITNFLLRLRGVNTAAGAINPITSSTVTNVNRLIDQGRTREALGQGGLDTALMLLGLKKGPAAIEATQRAARNPLAPLRVMGQEMGGAGKEPIVQAARARENVIATRQGAYEEGARRTAQTNAERLAQEHADKAKLAEEKSAYAKKEFGVRQAERGAQAATAQREVAQRARTEYARLISDNVKSTAATAKTALNARWNQLAERMNQPRLTPDGAIQSTPVAGVPIRDAIEQARNEFLVGSPEDLKAFDDLMGRLRDPSIESSEYAKPLGWNEARTHFTNINDRLFSGSLQPNVYRALRLVRDSLDEQLGKAAQSRGLGSEYQSLKKDWSQYKSDFDDLSSISTGGGSPLARLVRFPTIADAEALLKGRYGEDIAGRLAKYQNRGANPKLVNSYRELGRRIEGIEKPKVPTHPARVTRTVPPAELKPTPPPPKLPPEVQPYAIRLKRLEELSGRPASIWDLYPPRAVERLALKSPALREWIARQPRKELKP